MNPLQSLDQILDNLVVDAWFGGKRAKGGAEKLKDKGVEELLQWALDFLDECLGEEDKIGDSVEGSSIPMQFTEVGYRNQFRTQAKATALSLLKQGGGE